MQRRLAGVGVRLRLSFIRMSNSDITTRLHNLDDQKLIVIVKNYRQYGYTEEIRASAISILEQRGVTKEMLIKTGNFENQDYENAKRLYRSYDKNSRIAFLFHIGMITLFVLLVVFQQHQSLSQLLTVLVPIAAMLYMVFLIRSFVNLSKFGKEVEKQLEVKPLPFS